MKINEILIKPLVTEKTTKMVNEKVYSFQVNAKANKNQIKKTVEEIFKVKVRSVRVISRLGKVRRTGKKMMKKQMPGKKIAYVSLKEGKIDIFPQS